MRGRAAPRALNKHSSRVMASSTLVMTFLPDTAGHSVRLLRACACLMHVRRRRSHEYVSSKQMLMVLP